MTTSRKFPLCRRRLPSREMRLARSIATRLTDAESGEFEAAAVNAGKKVAEWLREAALGYARASALRTKLASINHVDDLPRQPLTTISITALS